MNLHKKMILGLAMLMSAALLHEVSVFAADAVTTATDQKTEKQHVKKSPGVKKKKHHKPEETSATVPATNSTNKS